MEIDKTAPYVVLAYMGLWLIVFVYLVVLGIKISSLRRELNLLKSLVKENKEG